MQPQTTRWIDKKAKSLNEVLELMMSRQDDNVSSNSMNLSNWTIHKIFSEDQCLTLNGRTIVFNKVDYTYQQITAGRQPIEDRTTQKDGFIIVFKNGENINYIINKNSDAQRVLRNMLGYTGKSEIEKNMPPIDSDIFMWLIDKVYSQENVIESNSAILHDVSIDTVRGFKADTEDLLTKVSADGESVMNIISTLSFFLESQNLKQIKIDIAYDAHNNIELVLTNRPTVATSMENYMGDLGTLDNKDLAIAQLLLIIYIEVLPSIIQAYESEISLGLWDNDKNIDFLKRVADDLQRKVEEKIKMLKMVSGGASINNATKEKVEED